MEQLELFPDSLRGITRLTVSEALELLWEYHLIDKPSGRTYTGNRKAICRSMGHRYFDELTFLDVAAHKRDRPPGAAFHDHGLLSLLFNTLAKWRRNALQTPKFDFRALELPQVSPTLGIRRGSPGARDRVVSPKEFARWAEHAPQKLLDIVILRLDTGLRGTDIERLTPAHLNRFNNEIKIEQSKTRRSISVPASRRVVAIFDRAAEESRQFVCDFTGLTYWWRRTRKAANLPDVQLRDFRRSGPSWAYEKFPDYNAMGEFLGHRDPRSTRRYVVIRRKHIRKIVEHIAREYA